MAGKLLNNSFSLGDKISRWGKGFSAIVCNGTCIILGEEIKFQWEATERRQGKCLNPNLAGKQIFLAGHPLILAGIISVGSLLGGVLFTIYCLLQNDF